MLTCGTKAWVVGAGSLHGLERAEHMVVGWMCGVSLGGGGLVQSFGCSERGEGRLGVWSVGGWERR